MHFTHFDITLRIHQQILWLQISVYEIQRVEIFESQEDLSRVKPRMWLAVNIQNLNFHHPHSKVEVESKQTPAPGYNSTTACAWLLIRNQHFRNTS